jgi:hypothetical protein
MKNTIKNMFSHLFTKKEVLVKVSGVDPVSGHSFVSDKKDDHKYYKTNKRTLTPDEQETCIWFLGLKDGDTVNWDDIRKSQLEQEKEYEQLAKRYGW